MSDLSVGFRDLASLGSQPRIVWESTSSGASGGAHSKSGVWRDGPQVRACCKLGVWRATLHRQSTGGSAQRDALQAVESFGWTCLHREAAGLSTVGVVDTY